MGKDTRGVSVSPSPPAGIYSGNFVTTFSFLLLTSPFLGAGGAGYWFQSGGFLPEYGGELDL